MNTPVEEPIETPPVDEEMIPDDEAPIEVEAEGSAEINGETVEGEQTIDSGNPDMPVEVEMAP
jgi:hypothetical protein